LPRGVETAPAERPPAARPPPPRPPRASAGGAAPASSDVPSISVDARRRSDDHLVLFVELCAVDDMGTSTVERGVWSAACKRERHSSRRETRTLIAVVVVHGGRRLSTACAAGSRAGWRAIAR